MSARDRILAAAAELFVRHGFHGVSTREIAKHSGVNEITIYRIFVSKQALFFEVLDAELGGLYLRGDLLTTLAESPTREQALHAIDNLIVSALNQKPNIARLILFASLEFGEQIHGLLRRHLDQQIELLVPYLDRAISPKDIGAVDARRVILQVIANRYLEQIFSWMTLDESGAISQFLDRLADL